MADNRRSRRSGSSPGGRDSRRSGRSESSRRTDRTRRAPEGKPTPEVSDRDRPPRVVKGKKSEPTPERTILGLSTARAVILAVVVCALALTLAVPLRTYFTQRAEAAQVAADHNQLQADVNALRAKKAQQDDPAYITAEARNRLRLVKPGETPFQVQLPGAFEAEQARRAKPVPEGGPWYTDLFGQVSQPQNAAEPNQPGGPTG
ncbi:septum formation initiator family protein [Antrihabitans sp. YC3-6]|uniref:Septum formation initiator family protein n=1 Tax=Antrihabitans stalagmiti TaxID=2799499 RepID=A0A934U4K7_9NOCA|nr:septum formation initiator family protein [Antrihabitans stalagmiti]MBJ8340457.1 septum formation initiator family protein [Antrihabitans stalagmiti]